MTSLDAHSYDGKLRHFKTKLQQDIIKCSWLKENLLSFQESLKEAQIFLASNHKDAKNALAALRLFEIESQNYDPTNDLNVSEIFPIIWAAIRSLESRMSPHDALITRLGFFEQLEDIVLKGPCAQGRNHRLLMYYALIETI